VIHHGDLFDVLPTITAESIDSAVTDPPYGIGLRGLALKLGFDGAVTTLAERQEVWERIRGEVVAVEEPVWSDVVDVATGLEALLAGIGVALSRLALLSLPVWATVAGVSVDELWMSVADPIGVTARPRTVFAFPVRADVTRTSSEAPTTTDARQLNLSRESRGDGGVLAGRRTGSAASVLQPGRLNLKVALAGLAPNRNHASILQAVR
jgi:hypothetical protein